jgi:hypothetical protein
VARHLEVAAPPVQGTLELQVLHDLRAVPRSGTRSFSDATNLAVADLVPFMFLDESGKIVK